MKYRSNFENLFKLPTGDQTFLKDIEKKIQWMVYKSNSEICLLIKDHHREDFFVSHISASLFNFTSDDERKYRSVIFPFCENSRNLDVVKIFKGLNSLKPSIFEPGLDKIENSLKTKDLVVIIKALEEYFDYQKELLNDFDSFSKFKKVS